MGWIIAVMLSGMGSHSMEKIRTDNLIITVDKIHSCMKYTLSYIDKHTLTREVITDSYFLETILNTILQCVELMSYEKD